MHSRQWKRREVITVLSGAAMTWPLAARAQQAWPVVAFVSNVPRESYAGLMSAFTRGLGDRGFAEGQNVTFDYRWVDSEQALGALAAEMVARNPSVIVGVGGTASALALKRATTSLPIIFIIGSDPAKFGLVTSLNRPGGNMTGVTSLSNSLAAKQVEMLHDLVPKARTIACLINPENPNADHDAADVRRAVETVGQNLIVVTARSEAEVNAAFAAATRQRAHGMLVASDLFFLRRRAQIVILSARYALPTMYDRPEYVATGGLMSYGSNRGEVFRQAGVYTGRILKGERPGELPVQQPTKFDLVINLQTAKALDIEVPSTLLARADEVIE
jgi:putative ABC transport system substrate-binding protein